MTVTLKHLTHALKAANDIPTIMEKAQRFWKVPSKDTDYIMASQTDNKSIKWILDGPEEEVTQFLVKCAKAGLIAVAPTTREAPARTSRHEAPARTSRREAVPVDKGLPREGSKMAQAVELLQRSRKGISREDLAEQLGWTKGSIYAALTDLRHRGFNVEKVGGWGESTYRIVA